MLLAVCHFFQILNYNVLSQHPNYCEHSRKYCIYITPSSPVVEEQCSSDRRLVERSASNEQFQLGICGNKFRRVHLHDPPDCSQIYYPDDKTARASWAGTSL